jgi:hypothetical protein
MSARGIQGASGIPSVGGNQLFLIGSSWEKTGVTHYANSYHSCSEDQSAMRESEEPLKCIRWNRTLKTITAAGMAKALPRTASANRGCCYRCPAIFGSLSVDRSISYIKR